MVGWTWRIGPVVVPGHSSGTHPDGHICLTAWGHCRTVPKQRRTGPKRVYLYGGAFLLEYSQTSPLAIWMARGLVQERSWPLKWASGIWMSVSAHGAIWTRSIWSLLIAPSQIVPLQATTGAVQCSLSDHGRGVIRALIQAPDVIFF